jgi:hypothetical protein
LAVSFSLDHPSASNQTEENTMPAKPTTKRAVVAETFGIPVDPDDISYVNFLYARRHLSTFAERGRRELCYITEIDAIEQAILKTLDRIRARDGEKIFREATGYLREAIDIVVSERPRARSGMHEAHV